MLATKHPHVVDAILGIEFFDVIITLPPWFETGVL